MEDKINGQIWNVDETGLGLFDGFFTPQLCEKWIEHFKQCKKANMANIWHHPAGKNVADDSRVTLWPPNMNDVESIVTSTGFMKEFMTCFTELIYPKYAEVMIGLKHYKWSIDSAKIQKTLPGGGYHMWHTEDQNLAVSRRLFVVQLYLNTVKEGGETEFLCQKKRISAKQGRVVIFPATYTHYHRGNPPISNEKYVMNLWGEFAE